VLVAGSLEGTCTAFVAAGGTGEGVGTTVAACNALRLQAEIDKARMATINRMSFFIFLPLAWP
jgi:hypothetical protein